MNQRPKNKTRLPSSPEPRRTTPTCGWPSADFCSWRLPWSSVRRSGTSLSTSTTTCTSTENPCVLHGLTDAGIALGLHHRPCRQLASADLALPHARLPALWPWARRASSDQRPAARRHGGPPVPGPAADDRRSVAQRLRGGRVCHPSAAGGVGGLGGRAERRPQRPVLHADPRGLRRLRPPALLAGPLPHGGRVLRLGPDVQADAGDAAVCAAVVGLLAAGAESAAGTLRVPCRRATSSRRSTARPRTACARAS